jgi:hypothetical protein
MLARTLLGIVIVLALAIAGAGVIHQMPSSMAHSSAHIPAVVPAPHGHLPSHVDDAGDLTRAAYQAALDAPEVLASVPCTCGCEPLGHMNNLDCYIRSTAPDGTVFFDTHGINCGVCQLITQDAMDGAAAGMSPAELHAMIVAKYGS